MVGDRLLRALRTAGLTIGAAFALYGPLAIPPASAAALKTIKVVYIPIGDSLPLYVAKDHGFFEKRGLDVELKAVPNAGAIITGLVSGSADIGTSVAPTALQAQQAGLKFTILAGAVAFPEPKLGVGILARTGSGIHKAQDLVGKSIGVATLRSYHWVMTRRWLQESGVDPNKVKYVEVPFPEQGDALKAGRIDAAVSVDPFYRRIVDRKIGYSFADMMKTVPDGTLIDFYLSTRKWAEANRDAIAKFIDAMAEGQAYIKAHDKEVRGSLAKWTKLPPGIADHVTIPEFKLPVNAGQIAWWIDLLQREGLLHGKMDPNSVLLTGH